MVIGSLIGYYQPIVSDTLAEAQFAEINAIVAVLLWCMIFPMLVQIDFQSLKSVRYNPGAIALTTAINYLIKPFTMYALALIFFRAAYTSLIPDKDLRDNYIAGLILLAGAPCTAMVFVWSSLTGGDGAYTLVQVAFNDLLMLVLYVPTAVMLIGVSDIQLPWLTIIYAVILFIVAPLVISAFIRWVVIKYYGEKFLKEKIVNPFKPFTIVALLLTLVLIFIFQGQKIGDKPLQIVLIAIPIIIQCILNWAICYYIGFKSCIPHERLAPASMIATSNFFELAVAVAISVYGLQSGAALATVVGVLVEVPVMLILTFACNYMKPMLDERCAKCDDLCAWSNKLASGLPMLTTTAGCCSRGNTTPSSATSSTKSQVNFEMVQKQDEACVCAIDSNDISAGEVLIYHNPECETSRNVLQFIRSAGYEPVVVDYIIEGWTRPQLVSLFAAAGLTPRTALRDTKSPAKAMGLLDANVSEDVILDAMLQHSILVNRPIVCTEKGVKLCRPSETVFEILEKRPEKNIAIKEDGTKFVL